MDERSLVLRLLQGPASGDALARAGGYTRAAVWKRIESLRSAGLTIDALPGRGYRLATPLDVLDADAIAALLPDGARHALAALEVRWSIDSTNTALLREAPLGGGARALLAERQTAGRGRRGRAWQSPLAANLYLSLARTFEGGLARLGGLSLVAGIAVAEALQAFGLSQVGLKWPNDVVVEHGDGLLKLGGLLVEGGGESAGPVRAVIGIGLNMRMPASAAAAIDQPWTDLCALMPDPPSRNTLAAAVLEQLLPALETFDEAGLAPFLPRYAALDRLHDRDVLLRLPGGDERAHAVGLASDGALQLRMPDGSLRAVHAGEVSLRRSHP